MGLVGDVNQGEPASDGVNIMGEVLCSGGSCEEELVAGTNDVGV